MTLKRRIEQLERGGQAQSRHDMTDLARALGQEVREGERVCFNPADLATALIEQCREERA